MPKEATILVVGACALDRILHLESYPPQDSKTRCSQTFEYGGGNAANTASTLARMSDAKFLKGGDDTSEDGGWASITIKLLSKIGNDSVKDQICCELEEFGVDLSSPLFKVDSEKSSTTPIATVIVTTMEPHSRTCLYDPGTCGVLTAQDVQHIDLDHIFENVIHLHSDSRHTEAAALLAKDAQRRGIPVSVDVERDRLSQSFDDLLDAASMIFTNENKMSCTLKRRLVDGLTFPRDRGDLADVAYLCHAIESLNTEDASCRRKDVVVTLGSKGSVQCQYLDPRDKERQDLQLEGETMNYSTIADANYELTFVGKPRNVKVIDTTGAGDAFIGGYILSHLFLQSYDEESPALNKAKFCLDFGSWVAGKKIMGPGARATLPSGLQINEELGSGIVQIKNCLQYKVDLFSIG